MATSALPKSAGKRKIKRTMLGVEPVSLLTIAKERNDEAISIVVNYLKQFTNRTELDKCLLLGFNSISRKVEKCKDDLKIVLLNCNVSAQNLIVHLQELCRLKCVPVCCLQDFHLISQSLQPTVKGLKNDVTAIGFLVACNGDFQQRLLSLLPPVVIREEPPPKKRRDISKPQCPVIEYKCFYINDDKPSDRDDPMSLGGVVSFAEDSIPFVCYDSFIGSHRPLESVVQTPQTSTENSRTTNLTAEKIYKEPTLMSR